VINPDKIIWTDLITHDQWYLPLAEYERIWQNWTDKAIGLLAEAEITDLKGLCWELYHFLCKSSYPSLAPPTSKEPALYTGDLPPCRHASGSYINDHALLTSAIAYCLGYPILQPEELLLLRAVALAHDFPPDKRRALLNLVEEVDWERAESLWRGLDQQVQWLEDQALAAEDCFAYLETLEKPIDVLGQILFYAHLAASTPLYDCRIPSDEESELWVVQGKEHLQAHPLLKAAEDLGLDEKPIGLVLGGATKIKGYVFESGKLPEMRGGSALLDRLNLLDCRALFGERNERYGKVPTFCDAPECVIYANGGDVLALAPATLGNEIAAAIEALYTQETLTGRCVAVADCFDLIELQYGLEPTAFWWEDYLAAWQDEETRKVLEAYYGRADNEAGAKVAFFKRKAFGELATSLALQRFRRREGNEDGRGRQPVVQFETIPYLRRCHSCDHRGAVVYIPLRDEYLCEPCARKRVVGELAKKLERDIRWFTDRFIWKPPEVRAWYWGYEEWLGTQGLADDYAQVPLREVDNPRDLSEIGQVAKPRRFIGLVYGDGNNVGAIIEKIRTPAEYRQFAHKLFDATQKAVFRALADNLKATKITRRDERTGKTGEEWIHPFEIISIGGDDVFLIVPGDKALPIARDIARYLEEAFQSRCLATEKGLTVHRYRPLEQTQPVTPEPQPAISLSAGVIIAGENTPIFFLHDLVTALLKSAKAKAKELKEQGYRGGTLDFLILKAIPMVTTELTDFREAAYLVEFPKACLRLTARPYTLVEVDGLLAAAQALKRADFPRTQLHAMRRYIRLGRMTATVNYLYFRIRSRASDVLNRAFDLSWHRQPGLVPWRQVTTGDKETWETSLLDLVEIYDFVAEE